MCWALAGETELVHLYSYMADSPTNWGFALHGIWSSFRTCRWDAIGLQTINQVNVNVVTHLALHALSHLCFIAFKSIASVSCMVSPLNRTCSLSLAGETMHLNSFCQHWSQLEARHSCFWPVGCQFERALLKNSITLKLALNQTDKPLLSSDRMHHI